MRESRRPPFFKCSVPRSKKAPGNAFFIIRPDGSDGPNKPNRPNEANRDDKPNGSNGTNGMDMAVMLADACGWLCEGNRHGTSSKKYVCCSNKMTACFFQDIFHIFAES